MYMYVERKTMSSASDCGLSFKIKTKSKQIVDMIGAAVDPEGTPQLQRVDQNLMMLLMKCDHDKRLNLISDRKHGKGCSKQLL